MKTPSVQARLTLWYTLLMAGMGGLLLGFLVLISGTVSTQTAMDQLEATLRRNLSQITQGADGAPQLGEEFAFYDNGVYTLVYSQGEALLAGQVPVSFTASEPFQNGQNRPVDVAGARYYVMDFWLPNGWESGLWVRGILEAPENPQLLTNLMFIAMVTLPAFLLLAALGGYGIARRAFRPLKEITSTAAAINEAADLSARVAVPPGDHEFSRLAATFNQMFARLEGAFEAEKQFTADASHELRTPVSVIKSACEYAEKYGETPEEQRETLAMIHRQADRMAELIQQLLSITRLDQGTEGLRLEPLDLAALVEGVCAEQPYPGSGCSARWGARSGSGGRRPAAAAAAKPHRQRVQVRHPPGPCVGHPGGEGEHRPPPGPGRRHRHPGGPAGEGLAAVLPGGPLPPGGGRGRPGPGHGEKDRPAPRGHRHPGQRPRPGERLYPASAPGEKTLSF